MNDSILIGALVEQFKAKLQRYAYDSSEVDPGSRLYYFVISSDCNSRVVLFAPGKTREEARTRLESSLRLIGAGHLVEYESGEVAYPFDLWPRCKIHEIDMNSHKD